MKRRTAAVNKLVNKLVITCENETTRSYTSFFKNTYLLLLWLPITLILTNFPFLDIYELLMYDDK